MAGTRFDLALTRPMGTTRGKAAGSLAAETARQVLEFYRAVAQPIGTQRTIHPNHPRKSSGRQPSSKTAARNLPPQRPKTPPAARGRPPVKHPPPPTVTTAPVAKLVPPTL